MESLQSPGRTKRNPKTGGEQALWTIKNTPVLVADDDAALREELVERLGTTGQPVKGVGDGAALLAQLDALSGPAVVLLDLHIPDSDVCDLLNGVARFRDKVALVLFSGKHDAILEYVARLAEAKNLRVAGTLSKPVRYEDLWPLVEGAAETLGGDSPARTLDVAAPTPRLTAEDLGLALDRQEFQPFYQPQFSLKNGQCHTVEALARWQHPGRGWLTPQYFLPDIKHTNLMGPFSEAIVRRVMADLCRWHNSGLFVNAAINVPPKLLEGPEFAGFVMAEVSRWGIDPHHLVLELVEDELLPEPETVLDSLIRLRVAGFRISVDDFGSEYSSLNRLLWLPISELKIDRSLVAAVNGTKNAAIIIGNTVELAHQMGFTVVAEGIEEEATLDKLKTLGCDAGQGFLFARPMTADRVTAYFQDDQNVRAPAPLHRHTAVG